MEGGTSFIQKNEYLEITPKMLEEKPHKHETTHKIEEAIKKLPHKIDHEKIHKLAEHIRQSLGITEETKEERLKNLIKILGETIKRQLEEEKKKFEEVSKTEESYLTKLFLGEKKLEEEEEEPYLFRLFKGKEDKTANLISLYFGKSKRELEKLI